MQSNPPTDTTFLAGAGVHDITGPAAERIMMGYVSPLQQTQGIHMRLGSRAFVFVDSTQTRRLAFVSADLCMIFQCLRQMVVERLAKEFGDLYDESNVVLSATHTHSGPGGYSFYKLYYLTCGGFDRANTAVIAEGIFQSIRKAHTNLAPSTVSLAIGDLLNASVNRSPEAYQQNPASERASYAHDTDKRMTLLRIQGMDGREVGMLNWFAVHGTSMGNDNKLISGDNKGLASYLVETEMGTDYRADCTYVAAFAQGHEGDVSPNIFGNGDGCGANDMESVEISARKQRDKAMQLCDEATTPIAAAIDSRLRYVDLSRVEIAGTGTNDETHHTCRAALGLSMLAGTEDGRGVGTEGTGRLKRFLTAPFHQECQAEKDIVLPIAKVNPPLAPEVLPLQLARIGPLVIIAVPFELSTMAGRRLQATVLDALRPIGVEHAVIAGLSNAYAGYVTTREEYRSQQYEGGSTHFGPWTLAALQQEFNRIALQMANGERTELGPEPRTSTGRLFNLRPGVWVDVSFPFRRIGSVRIQPRENYSRGQTVSVEFWGGHPRNDFLTQSTYLEVQRRAGEEWVISARDWDPETIFMWDRRLLVFSLITVKWTIPSDAPAGAYRILLRGHRKRIFREPQPYEATTREFRVV